MQTAAPAGRFAQIQPMVAGFDTLRAAGATKVQTYSFTDSKCKMLKQSLAARPMCSRPSTLRSP